jgi:hypothetical protein
VVSPSQTDIYLTTHSTHKTPKSMPPAGFEPAIPASERPKTHAFDRAVTGFCIIFFVKRKSGLGKPEIETVRVCVSTLHHVI